MARTIRFGEARSGLSARAVLLDDKTPGAAEACSAIRRNGACVITLERAGA